MFIYVTENGRDDLHYLIEYRYETGIDGINADKYDFDINFSKATNWYLAASNNGDSRADYRLGMMHEYGKDIDKNLDKAIHYYERASLKGNTDASYRLACFYLDGYGITQDLLKAFYYYTEASIEGHEQATKALIIFEDFSSIYLHFNDSHDVVAQICIYRETKVNMLEKATEEGYTQLQYQIGIWYDKKK
jgi:hypothetical protein